MKITDQPVVVFFAAVISAFVGGISAYAFLQERVEEISSAQIKALISEGKLKGNDGLPGKDGTDGTDGPQGPQGEKGDPGEDGPQGPRGDKGNDGLPGDKFPVGVVISFFGNEAPDGWLICDGTSFARNDYPDLYDHLVELNENQFRESQTVGKLPDLRAMFLRGLNGTRDDKYADKEKNRSIGSVQPHEYNKHSHLLVGRQHISHAGNNVLAATGNSNGSEFRGASTEDNGGEETRPNNVAVNFIIKY